MKIFSSKKRVAAIGVVTAATLVGGGMAYAYWTTTGSGQGAATTAVGADGDLSFTQNSLAAMYPGDDPQDLIVTVQNDNPDQSAYVGSLTASIAGVAGCDGTNFLINGSPADVPVDLEWDGVELAAGGGSASTPLALDPNVNTIQFNNKPTTDQELCKAVTVAITYQAS